MSTLQKEVKEKLSSLATPLDMTNEPNGVKALELPVDYSKVDRTWERYGITEAPLLVRDFEGGLYANNKNKVIMDKEKYQSVAKAGYVVLPNQYVDETLHNLVDGPMGKELGLKIQETHYAKNKYIQFWELRTTDESKFQGVIEGSHQVNDVVQLGLIVGNSLNAGMSFMANLFTFRLICSNGAVARGRELESIKVAHYGQDALQNMIANLERRLSDMLYEGMDILKQYQKMAKLKLHQELAEKLVNTVGVRYTPTEYIEVTKESKTSAPEIVLTSEGRATTLWQAFNDITEPVWKNERTRFNTKLYLTTGLHKVMFDEVEYREATGSL